MQKWCIWLLLFYLRVVLSNAAAAHSCHVFLKCNKNKWRKTFILHTKWISCAGPWHDMAKVIWFVLLIRSQHEIVFISSNLTNKHTQTRQTSVSRYSKSSSHERYGKETFLLKISKVAATFDVCMISRKRQEKTYGSLVTSQLTLKSGLECGQKWEKKQK